MAAQTDFTLRPANEISRTVIRYKDMEVTELVLDEGSGKHKLVWVRGRFESPTVLVKRELDGLEPVIQTRVEPSPLFHIDYEPGKEDEAKQRVQALFDEYWAAPDDKKREMCPAGWGLGRPVA